MNMELHIYERMAQRKDNAVMNSWQGSAGDCLIPQPMTIFPAQTPVGMSYVPYQMWKEPYDAETALCRGTMFPELDLPFTGGGCCE